MAQSTNYKPIKDQGIFYRRLVDKHGPYLAKLETLGNSYRHYSGQTDHLAKFNIAGLAKELDVQIVFQERLPFRGRFDSKNRKILINAVLCELNYLNFIILHELCHVILKHKPGDHSIFLETDLVNVGDKSLVETTNEIEEMIIHHMTKEYEAGRLVSSILMPKERFLSVFTGEKTNRHRDKWSIDRARDHFGASRPLVIRRANQLLLAELDVPSHSIRTVNRELAEFERFDSYKIIEDPSSITRRQRALFYTPPHDFLRSHGTQWSTKLERNDGRLYASYVVTRFFKERVISDSLTIPVEYAHHFRFFQHIIQPRRATRRSPTDYWKPQKFPEKSVDFYLRLMTLIDLKLKPGAALSVAGALAALAAIWLRFPPGSVAEWIGISLGVSGLLMLLLSILIFQRKL